MKKNGFTLVELIAVIVVLAIIAIIVTANVNTSIEDSKDKLYVEQINAIVNAAKQYTKSNLNSLPEDGSCSQLAVEELITSGYLKAEYQDAEGKYYIKNPKDDSKMNGHVSIRFDYGFNQYEYNYETNLLCENQAVVYNNMIANYSASESCYFLTGKGSIKVVDRENNIYKYYETDNCTE